MSHAKDNLSNPFSGEIPQLKEKNKFLRIALRYKFIIIGLLVLIATFFTIAQLYVKVPSAMSYISYSETKDPCANFTEIGLKCEIQKVSSDNLYNGSLINQSVEVGEYTTKGTTITLTYSSGPEESRMPDLTGLSSDDAKKKLYDLGVGISHIEYISEGGLSKDRVVKASVEVGEKISSGDDVTLYLSNGVINIPDWVGKSQEFVEAEAQELNLSVTFIEEESDIPSGVVLRQTPTDGEHDTNEIIVTVSKYVDSVAIEIPDVIGKNSTDAQTTLALLGFKNITTVKVNTSSVDSEQVTQIVPAVGALTNSDSNIVIIVSIPEG